MKKNMVHLLLAKTNFYKSRIVDKQKHYLETLGFTTGATIEVLSELHGYFIVLIKESKIGLEKRLAQNVILIAE